MDALTSFSFGMLIGMAMIAVVAAGTFYPVNKPSWSCTASTVTKETLPREEECTQYTRKAKP